LTSEDIVNKIIDCADIILNKYNKASLYCLDHHTNEFFALLKKQLQVPNDNLLLDIVNNNGVLNRLKSYNYYNIILLFAGLSKRLDN